MNPSSLSPLPEIDLDAFSASNPTPSLPATAKPGGTTVPPAKVYLKRDGTPYAESTASAPAFYPASPLCGSAVEHDAKNHPDALYNNTLPSTARVREKPEHRIMIMLKLQAFSNREIADKMGCTEGTVCQILRQPWAQLRLIAEINEAGRDPINELLRGEIANTIFTLIEVRDSTSSKASDKISASKEILDRFLGKPVQRIEAKNENTNTSDVSEMERKLAELRREEARLVGDAASVTVTNTCPQT